MNILDEIVKQKKREVAKLPARLIAAGDLRDAMLERVEHRDFLAALRNPHQGSAAVSAANSPAKPAGETPALRQTVALIAEVKKASPSAYVICQTLIRSASPKNMKRQAQAAFPF